MKIETVASAVKLSKRLSTNYKLRKCLCDCSTSHSVERKSDMHKPHRSRWRTQTNQNNSAIIGSVGNEPKRFTSGSNLKQHLNASNSAAVAKDKADVALPGESHEAEQNKVTGIPTSNNLNNQKVVQQSRANIDDTPYHCDRCKKQYSTSRGLQNHYVFHTRNRPFVCKVCAKMFPTLIHLMKHSLVHIKGQAYECQLCDKKFRFLMSLKKHVLFHTGERPYECMLYNKRFFTLPHLKNHIHIHTGENPFVCRLCGKGFLSPDGLRKHRFYHARGQAYYCRFCSRQFRRYRLLVRHIETQKIKKYECGECHRVFSSLSLVRKHAATHSSESYACTLCSSGFFNSTSLLLHYRTHKQFEHNRLTSTRSDDGTETPLTS
jgi:uncharacterized Zn-finger protein